MDPNPKTKGLWLYPRQWNLELVGAAKLPNRMGRIRLFPLLFQNGRSQSSRFPTAGHGERGSGNEIGFVPDNLWDIIPKETSNNVKAKSPKICSKWVDEGLIGWCLMADSW